MYDKVRCDVYKGCGVYVQTIMMMKIDAEREHTNISGAPKPMHTSGVMIK